MGTMTYSFINQADAAPSTTPTRPQRWTFHPYLFGPFCDRLRQAVDGQCPRLTLVVRLLFLRGPCNISWLVVPVIINAVKRVLRTGLASDLLQEFGKRLKPKLNTASAIVGIDRCVGICATIFSQCVSAVFNAHFTVRCFAMCQMPDLNLFGTQAAARSGVAVEQVRCHNTSGFAASTNTFPSASVITNILNVTQSSQTSELLAR